MGIERRFYELKQIEVRDMMDGDGHELGPRLIFGYAAIFNTPSEDLGGFVEQIMPGAFTNTLVADDIRALWNHNPDYPLGRNLSGTLRLAEDNTGLRIEIDTPETSAGRDALISIARGDVNQMSFAFSVMREEWTIMSGQAQDNDDVLRTLHEVKLYEVSPVVFPAYPQTSVGVRSGVLDNATLPSWVRARLAGNGGERAQVRHALRRRRLHLLDLA